VSRNYITVFLFTLFILSIESIGAKEIRALNEDKLLMQGLLYEEYGSYEGSRKVFGKLYDETGAKAYLFREITSSLLSGSHISRSISRLLSWDKKHPGTLEVKRLLIPLYLTNREAIKAKEQAQYLIENSSDAKDLDLASNSYLYTGDFQKALQLLERAYEKTHNDDVLFRMTVIMDEYTKERTKAMQLLETHIRMNKNVNEKIYAKLLSLYIKENNVDGVLGTYKMMYAKDARESYLKKIIDAYAYKGDLGGALDFLENNKIENETLYELYKMQKKFQKALTYAEKKYARTKNPKWLAEKAILIFEKAENKKDKKMISEVVSHFEKAVLEGVDDSIYLNYYGYTLIDNSINIKKGIDIVSSALNQQPDNTYYMDSLAWGYHKEKKCIQAYKLMKKVVEIEGLKEPEIIEHWNAIKKCK